MNKTPRTITPLGALSRRALAAARELTPTLPLRASAPDLIAEDVDDLFGRPPDPAATPPVEWIEGKLHRYSAARADFAAARSELRVARKKAREFVAQAVDTLKVKLGRRWNPRWEAVGFTNSSLELPADPLGPLTSIRAYYAAHPEHEAAIFDLTAADAETMKNSLEAAIFEVDRAHAAESSAKRARDAAVKKLRGRITLLREELTTLLPPDDARWYRFGFRRPVDGQTPDLVEAVEVLAATPGAALVTWSRARLAENYRVRWNVADSSEPPTPVGLFADRQALITDLSRGSLITVIVTARNAAGESAPVEVAFAVP